MPLYPLKVRQQSPFSTFTIHIPRYPQEQPPSSFVTFLIIQSALNSDSSTISPFSIPCLSEDRTLRDIFLYSFSNWSNLLTFNNSHPFHHIRTPFFTVFTSTLVRLLRTSKTRTPNTFPVTPT